MNHQQICLEMLSLREALTNQVTRQMTEKAFSSAVHMLNSARLKTKQMKYYTADSYLSFPFTSDINS